MSTLLVDGDNIAMRALHAVPEGTMSAEGVNTGATVIFMSLLGRAVREHGVDRIMVGFDCHDPMHPLVRKAVFPDYKAQRKAAPEGREETFGLIWDILRDLEVTVVQVPSMEGDDLIASAWAWERAEHPEHEVLILSGDKDLLQLVDPRTRVLRPGNGALDAWDEQRVWEHYNLPPERLGHYLALVGDVSDNIPGVRGIGPKKAERLITEAMNLGHDFDRMVDRHADAWGGERVAQANLSWVLVDLREEPVLAPGVVAARHLDRRPGISRTLDERLTRYSLNGLRRSLESGSLFTDETPVEDVDLSQALLDLEGLTPTMGSTNVESPPPSR